MKVSILILLLLSSICSAQSKLVSRANEFLSTLDDKTKTKAVFSLDGAERYNFHFVPREKREGACYKFLSTEQRQAALSLLNASLSEVGYKKATEIMDLEKLLKQIEQRGVDDNYRDPLNYYFVFFGIPSDQKPWAWRIEGHHCAVNFAVDKGEIISSTPSFFGSNPGIVPTGEEKGKQILKQETELGFSLVNSLTPDQKEKAVIAKNAFSEIITGNKRKAELLSPTGISYTNLTKEQQSILKQLLDVYVNNYALGFSKTLMSKIQKAGFENLSFGWAGSLKPGEGHYYRIQGPMLLIEYDNTQNNANHVHTTVRDLTNDFAEDILREHYQKEHQ
jgi:hypothetical protein